MQCQAQIEDYANGERYNLAHVLIVPLNRRCKRRATSRVAHLCLCLQHGELAVEGLVDDNGKVADRGSIRDVRKYPKKFPDGLYRWAKGTKLESL